MAAADYRIMTDATGQRIAMALEAQSIDKAAKADLTSIIATGTTNATGATITKGTYFYLNGALVQAKADIASGATFTSGTNYEAVTAGGLNKLNARIDNIVTTVEASGTVACQTALTYTGLSISIPPNSAYSVTARAEYNDSRPNTVAINSSSTNANANFATGSYLGVIASATLSNKTTYGTTLYVWAKYDSTGNNTIRLDGYYFKLA